MKKLLAILIFILIGFDSYSQSDSDINNLINSLSWKSITTSHSYHTFTLNYQDSVVRELIKIGKPAAIRLFNSIKIPNKTVIIHIILTNIYEPEIGNDNLPIVYIYKNCDDLIGWHHIYNGLIWEWYRDSDFTIKQQEIDKANTYWNSRLNEKGKSWLNDIDKIFKDLQVSDSLKYPCSRVYENNSDELDFKQIISLIDTKYPSDKFIKLFNILGNDSVISRYSDCFFISYGADGIDFRFNKENILTSVFIEEAYKGDLPYGLKYSDTKDIIERKIGLPDEKGTYVDNEWVAYKNEHIYLDYDKDKKVIKFVISGK